MKIITHRAGKSSRNYLFYGFYNMGRISVMNFLEFPSLISQNSRYENFLPPCFADLL